jgi:hypothetical protein
VTDQVPHPHKTTGTIMAVYLVMSVFWDRSLYRDVDVLARLMEAWLGKSEKHPAVS